MTDPRNAEPCHCGRDEIGHVHTKIDREPRSKRDSDEDTD